MRSRHQAPLLALALLAGLLAACGSTEDDQPKDAKGPVEVTNCGKPVRLDHPAKRAVAVNQPATELLLSLDLQDRMVAAGVSDTKVLASLKPKLADVDLFKEEFPSLEAVLDHEPDLIYATFAYTFSAEGIASRKKFEKFGVGVYQSPSECSGQDARQTRNLTMNDLYDEIGEVSTLFGVQERGRKLVSSLKRRAATASDGLDAKDVSLAWWYASTKTPYFAGCCGAPGIMTDAIGAKNAFGQDKHLWPEIGWESVADADPDVLVLADLGRGTDGDSAKAKIKFLESHPVTKNLTAVKKKRYIILPGTTMDPSIRNVDGIERVAKGLRDLGLAS